MNTAEFVADVATGLAGSYVGTRVMEPVSMTLYELESDSDRRREEEIRPGEPYQIAAQKMARWLGLDLTEQQVEKLGMMFHLGLGLSWGPVYTVFRRLTGIHPVLGGLLTGAAMSLLVDEGLTPALGFSAPNRAYPLAPHLRGMAAHLVYGLAIAGAAEVLYGGGRIARQRSAAS